MPQLQHGPHEGDVPAHAVTRCLFSLPVPRCWAPRPRSGRGRRQPTVLGMTEAEQR